MTEINLTAENFKKEVMECSSLILIDFWAEWCGPCKMIAPIVSQIADEYRDVLKVCKVNVDEQTSLAATFQIQNIPTLVLVKDGVILDGFSGYAPKNEIDNMIQNHLQ